jgi:hypothetical protein
MSQTGSSKVQGDKMNIFQLRIFNGKSWATVQTYGSRIAATAFGEANLKGSEWDVKEISLAAAIAEESK